MANFFFEPWNNSLFWDPDLSVLLKFDGAPSSAPSTPTAPEEQQNIAVIAGVTTASAAVAAVIIVVVAIKLRSVLYDYALVQLKLTLVCVCVCRQRTIKRAESRVQAVMNRAEQNQPQESIRQSKHIKKQEWRQGTTSSGDSLINAKQ